MRKRLIYGFLAALVLAVTARTAVLHASGGYNGNPTYCHAHDSFDFWWWYYECWLPDPPPEPF